MVFFEYFCSHNKPEIQELTATYANFFNNESTRSAVGFCGVLGWRPLVSRAVAHSSTDCELDFAMKVLLAAQPAHFMTILFRAAQSGTIMQQPKLYRSIQTASWMIQFM
jgi:hypothetical protein